MGCRIEILVGIRSMQAQERRINELVEVDVQIESIIGHIGRKLPVVHVVGHDWLFKTAGDALMQWPRRAAVWLSA